MAGLLKILFGLVASPALMQGIANMYPPYPAMVARHGYREHPDLIPTNEQLIQMRRRGSINELQYYGMMRDAGISEQIAQDMYTASANYLTAYDYITLWRRGELADDDLDTELSRIGFVGEQQEHAKRVTLYYPNPDDIVRFAVREVYTPQIVQQYGLDEDMPPEYLAAAARGGLSDDFARQYWRSHWQLPSPTQAFEMLHRGQLDEDQLQTYLRTADYMPYWRDKLTAISYRPLTRVDVRRMHKMGVLSRQQVFESYKAYGYNDDNAELMTEFTVRYNEGTEGQGEDAIILARYHEGYIDRATAINELLSAGYETDVINTLLTQVDEQIEAERIDLEADGIIDQYRAGVIDDNELHLQLTRIGVPNERLNIVIARELAQARSRVKSPSRTDIAQWLLTGVIDDDTWRGMMAGMGYSLINVERYYEALVSDAIADQYKLLPRTTYVKFFIEGRMSAEELSVKLSMMGYGPDDIEDLIAQAAAKIKPES